MASAKKSIRIIRETWTKGKMYNYLARSSWAIFQPVKIKTILYAVCQTLKSLSSREDDHCPLLLFILQGLYSIVFLPAFFTEKIALNLVEKVMRHRVKLTFPSPDILVPERTHLRHMFGNMGSTRPRAPICRHPEPAKRLTLWAK